MTSKEKLEALNYTWFYEPTCQEDADKREAIIKELETDLKLLEKYKRVMCEPIKDIMKDLERLECIENVLDNIANRLKLEVKNIFTLEAEIFNRLEVLEIIKNKAQNNRFFRGCLLRMFVDIEYDGKYFRTKKKIKDEDYEKIARWLDNDK